MVIVVMLNTNSRKTVSQHHTLLFITASSIPSNCLQTYNTIIKKAKCSSPFKHGQFIFISFAHSKLLWLSFEHYGCFSNFHACRYSIKICSPEAVSHLFEFKQLEKALKCFYCKRLNS